MHTTFPNQLVSDRLTSSVPHPKGPVYAATHARAIADLVLGAILRDESPDFVPLDDWMPRDDDKREVRALLDKRHRTSMNFKSKQYEPWSREV